MLRSFVCLQKAPLWGLFLLPVIFFYPASVLAGKAAIATAHPLATQAGHQILKQSGNAFDAAIAVSAVLAVVEPYSSGIGGGGFWLLHRASDGKQVMIDGRETAPARAHKNLYLDDNAEIIPGLSINGALAAGIPGEPAALVHLSENYGKLPLSQVLAPAIELAKNGFEVDAYYQKMARWRLAALQQSLQASEIFLQDDQVPGIGKQIVQKDLAWTLGQLAENGHKGFYEGEVARRLVKAVKEAGGIWSLPDLQQYQVKERAPVIFDYNGLRIVSAALPSSGGIVLEQILKVLSHFELEDLNKVETIHLVVEAMKRAYHDRARYLGDSDYVQVPLNKILDDDYLNERAKSLSLNQASQSEVFAVDEKGTDTTHFSIIDKHGNRVSATLSINYPFGSGFVAEGTGVLLNDEMDDFSSRPGTPNVYGLVGSHANAIEPGKRMLSSMSPTFVESEAGVAILGTPGGSRIITMVLLAILEMEKMLEPERWVSLPRYHHQYLPDVIQYESAVFDKDDKRILEQMGHQLKLQENDYGNMQAVFYDKKTGQLKAASDPRGIGQAVVE